MPLPRGAPRARAGPGPNRPFPRGHPSRWQAREQGRDISTSNRSDVHTLESLKCQGCGGGLTCDIFARKIACEHCGTVESLPPAGGATALGEEPLERLLELEQAEPLAKPEGMRVIHCRSCGAEASIPAQT